MVLKRSYQKQPCKACKRWIASNNWGVHTRSGVHLRAGGKPFDNPEYWQEPTQEEVNHV